MRFAYYLLIILIITICPIAATGQDNLSYSGSSTIGMGILEQGAIKAFKEKTGLEFTLVEHPGSGQGVQNLIDGKVTVAGASRQLKKKEINRGAKGVIIGFDAIAVFVHKKNPVTNLTKDQLKNIFTGKVKNWKQVGGKDAPITPNTEIIGEKRATLEVFKKIIMDNEPYAIGFKEIDLPADQIIHLSHDETGISTVSLGLLSSVSKYAREHVKIIAVNDVEPSEENIRRRQYLISRPLTIATKGAASGNARKFVQFMLSSEGQKFVAKNFIPMRTVK
jgi:phosphate transport system substrate-binding protein